MFTFAERNAERVLYEALSDLDVTDDIKDAFLDDPECMTIGSENDPKIKDLIEKLPADDDIDPPTEDEIKELEEGFDYDPESDSAIIDGLGEGFDDDEDFDADEFVDETDLIARNSDDYIESKECGGSKNSLEDYEPEDIDAIGDYLVDIYD